jgi:hypothetical protein
MMGGELGFTSVGLGVGVGLFTIGVGVGLFTIGVGVGLFTIGVGSTRPSSDPSRSPPSCSLWPLGRGERTGRGLLLAIGVGVATGVGVRTGVGLAVGVGVAVEEVEALGICAIAEAREEVQPRDKYEAPDTPWIAALCALSASLTRIGSA